MEQHLQVQLWVFGDQHLIPALQNAAITRLYKITVNVVHPSISTLRYSYENTTADSNLRKFMMDVLCAAFQAIATVDVGKIRRRAELIETLADANGLMADLTERFILASRRKIPSRKVHFGGHQDA